MSSVPLTGSLLRQYSFVFSSGCLKHCAVRCFLGISLYLKMHRVILCLLFIVESNENPVLCFLVIYNACIETSLQLFYCYKCSPLYFTACTKYDSLCLESFKTFSRLCVFLIVFCIFLVVYSQAHWPLSSRLMTRINHK